jgi:hypothetical protein
MEENLDLPVQPLIITLLLFQQRNYDDKNIVE